MYMLTGWGDGGRCNLLHYIHTTFRGCYCLQPAHWQSHLGTYDTCYKKLNSWYEILFSYHFFTQQLRQVWVYPWKHDGSINTPQHVELCWITAPSKSHTVKYRLILPRTGTKLDDEQISCQGWGFVELLQYKNKTVSSIILFIYSFCANHHQVHKQVMDSNEPYNYLNTFPLLLQ